MGKETDKIANKIAIIGGGITGVSTALTLASNKNNTIHIFEKRSHILGGPPYCHLHAGGMIYPEISLFDSKKLLHDCLEFSNKFKDCLDFRPTVVAYKKESKYSTDSLIFKCRLISLEYSFVSHKYNYILGNFKKYFATYALDDMLYFKKYKKFPKTDDPSRLYHDKYVMHFCNLLDDINSIKYPFVSVMELGIDKEKVESQLFSQLNKTNNIQIYTNTNIDSSFYHNSDYNIVINASATDLLSTKSNEKYEYKSSWLINTSFDLVNFPEIAIIGERETKNGMIQITPVSRTNNKFQIHCMRDDSTIISTTSSNNNFYKLKPDEIKKRCKIAIYEISKYFPKFLNSYPNGHCPGIQRIPYSSKHKRISKFKIIRDRENKNKIYIDVQTMKACSVINLTKNLKNNLETI